MKKYSWGEIGIYLHLPFCAQACPYCDYPFVTAVSGEQRRAFVEALCREIHLRSQEEGLEEALQAETVYLGGGTPSQLSEGALARILETVSAVFDTSAVQEVTLEANPDDCTPAYLEALRDLGIDRLSLGVQSFFDEDLRFLGRWHTADEARRAVPTARAAGFENVSVDLIFDLPGRRESQWQAVLETAVAQEPTHVTLYRLTAEAATPLGRRVASGNVTLPGEETLADRYIQAADVLSAAGYRQQEQTHFGRPGFEVKHTRRYWTLQPVLGLGPGAHSFRWANGEGEAPAERWANLASVDRYIEMVGEGQLPVARRETLSREMIVEEYLAGALRTAEGLDIEVLKGGYGYDLAEKAAVVDRLCSEDYLEREGGRLRLTRAGRLRLDAVTAALLPDA